MSPKLRWLVVLAVVVTSAADAAPVRKKRPALARRPVAKALPAKPAAEDPPQTPGIMVPRPVLLNRATPAEQRAHAVWTLRAALNVAALQCQYSPFLATVDNYNKMLSKHAGELAAAQTQMLSHFKRTQKAGAAAFDRYNTRSYNSFSTLDAQYSFCQAAGQAGQALRLADVGSMGNLAESLLPQLRSALRQVPTAAGLAVPPGPALPDFRMDQPVILES
jgi:hypothetical protein